MNVAYEDRKLHNDGILKSLMGYKEWFHYVGGFEVNGKVLTFMLGFPKSFTGMGAFGWISYDGRQFSLAGNKDTDKDGFYDLHRFLVQFNPTDSGYTLGYTSQPQPDQVYQGLINGKFPSYTFDIKTPDLDILINMKINTPKSVYQKEVFEWMPFKKRIASWFHSGDVSATLEGSIAGVHVKADSKKCRGWYERMWSKVPVLWSAEWFWFMSHMDNGAVFDLYIAKSAGTRVHALDECWLYYQEKFYEFPHYWARFPEELKEAVLSKKYDDIIGKHIFYQGENGENSFDATATITDFRQYEFKDYSAKIKYTNFMFDIEGKAVIDGSTISMKGRGAAERAPIAYWWV